MPEWPKVVTIWTYGDDQPVDHRVVPVEWWENIAARLDASQAAWKVEVDQAHDLARELYEEAKKMYDREFHGPPPACFARYEQEVGE